MFRLPPRVTSNCLESVNGMNTYHLRRTAGVLLLLIGVSFAPALVFAQHAGDGFHVGGAYAGGRVTAGMEAMVGTLVGAILTTVLVGDSASVLVGATRMHMGTVLGLRLLIIMPRTTMLRTTLLAVTGRTAMYAARLQVTGATQKTTGRQVRSRSRVDLRATLEQTQRRNPSLTPVRIAHNAPMCRRCPRIADQCRTRSAHCWRCPPTLDGASLNPPAMRISQRPNG